MLFLALAGITAVCLVFAELRLLAVVGLAVLLFVNPLLTLALFLAGATAALVFNNLEGDPSMDYEDYIPEALELVLAWDLPEEILADAVNEQAKLMAGLYPDYCQTFRSLEA